MLFWLSLVPKNLLSRLTGWVVHRSWPDPLRSWSMRWFAQRYKIDMSEAEFEMSRYPSIGALFTRRLKPGLRPIQGALIHPVDAELTEQGEIRAGLAIQVKGKTYAVKDLLGGRVANEQVEGGYFLTYYLCPTDYHRVHAPISGNIVKAEHIPGLLWPVNALSVLKIDQLFVVNERLVIEIESAGGPVFVVMVGATNVGKMTVKFDPSLVTNQGRKAEAKTYTPSIPVKAGDELGIFHMGSTVIMIYPQKVVTHPPRSGAVRMGQALISKN